MWLRHLSPVHRPRKPCSGCVEPSCAQWRHIKLLFPKRFVTKRCQTSRRRYLLGLWVLKNQVFDLGVPTTSTQWEPKKDTQWQFLFISNISTATTSKPGLWCAMPTQIWLCCFRGLSRPWTSANCQFSLPMLQSTMERPGGWTLFHKGKWVFLGTQCVPIEPVFGKVWECSKTPGGPDSAPTSCRATKLQPSFFLCIIPNLFCAGALEISGLWGYNIMQHEALGTVASDNMEPDGIAVPVGCDEDAWVGPEIRTLQ